MRSSKARPLTSALIHPIHQLPRLRTFISAQEESSDDAESEDKEDGEKDGDEEVDGEDEEEEEEDEDEPEDVSDSPSKHTQSSRPPPELSGSPTMPFIRSPSLPNSPI